VAIAVAVAAVLLVLAVSVGGVTEASVPAGAEHGVGHEAAETQTAPDHGSPPDHDSHRDDPAARAPAAAPDTGDERSSSGGAPEGEGSTGADAPTEAEVLIEQTAAHLVRWRDASVAEAAGYRSIGDGASGYEHLVHPLHSLDERILDPRRPESLVYRVGDGGRELVSAMYILPPGRTMEDVPDLGDPRAVWHTHEDLCFGEDGRLTGRYVDGRCVPAGTRIVTPPMLHVWVVEHPCGPFAGLDGHGGDCHASH
jgi:hypothetical protein